MDAEIDQLAVLKHQLSFVQKLQKVLVSDCSFDDLMAKFIDLFFSDDAIPLVACTIFDENYDVQLKPFRTNNKYECQHLLDSNEFFDAQKKYILDEEKESPYINNSLRTFLGLTENFDLLQVGLGRMEYFSVVLVLAIDKSSVWKFDGYKFVLELCSDFSKLLQQKYPNYLFSEADYAGVGFHFLSKSAFEGVVVHNKGVVKDCNDAFLRIVKCPRSKVIGRSILNFVSPDDSQHLRQIILYNNYNPCALHFQRNTGELYQVEVEGGHMRYGGSFYHLLAVRDGGEKLALQQQIDINSTKYETLVENLQGVVYICRVNPSWEMEYLSKGSLELFGFPPEEIVENKKRYSDLIHHKDRLKVRHKVYEAIQSKGTFEVEYRIITEAGELKWVHERGKVISLNNELFVEGFIVDVSERVAGQRRVTIFKAISDNALCGSVIMSENGELSYVNDYMAFVHGYEVGELVGKSIDIFHTPGQMNRVEELMLKTLERGFVELVEVPHKRKDGSEFVMLVSALAVENVDQDGMALAIIAFDVSNLKEAEEEIQIINLKYTTLLDSVNDAVYIHPLNENGFMNFIEVNKRAVWTSGYSRSELLNMSLEDVYLSSEVSDGYECLSKLRSRGWYMVESIYKTKDGKLIPVEVSSSVFYVKNKALVLTMVRDITERKEAEKQLRESEFRYRNLFDHSPVSIWKENVSKVLTEFQNLKSLGVTDLKSYLDRHPEKVVDFLNKIEVVQVNKAALEMFDTESIEELIEKLDTIHTRKSIQFVKNWLVSMYNGESNIQDESRVITLKGRKRDTYIRMVCDFETGIVILTEVDITDRKRAERNLEEYKEHLEELVKKRTKTLEASNNELEVYVYLVSHELRIPLRAISGFSEYLEEEYTEKLGTEGKYYLDVIRANSRKMDILITDLYELSKSTNVGLDFVELNMKEIAISMFMEIVDLEQKKNFEFVVHDIPNIVGDSTTIKQLWTNLISNALKYSALAEVKKIEIGYRKREEGMVDYYVRDYGVGFDPKYDHKLFDMFYRLHKDTEYEGSGIGLTIVKRVVERHKGKVWAESTLGSGATFWFSMPVMESENFKCLNY